METEFPTPLAAAPRDFSPCVIPLRDFKSPAAGEAHVWHLDLGELARSLQAALGGDGFDGEKTALSTMQLRFARRFYLRLLLGAYLGIPGKSVRISRSERGKPVIDPSAHPVDLHFSMAKSQDRLLIGFATSGPVGVDLEPVNRTARNALGVARRYFSGVESEALAEMDPSRLDVAFLRTWACKEAVVKASGLGIANQLCRFTVETDPARPASVLSIENDDPGKWSLGLVMPDAEYLGAVAIHDSSMNVRALRLLPADGAESRR